MSGKRETATARSGIASDFAAALAADFSEHGVNAIAKLREKDIAAYLRLVAAIEPPSERDNGPGPLGELSDDELADLIDAIRRWKEENPGNGSDQPMACHTRANGKFYADDQGDPLKQGGQRLR